MYEVSKCRGYESPHIYVESCVDVYQTFSGWIVEDMITGKEYEFTTKDDAESFTSRIEGIYEGDFNG